MRDIEIPTPDYDDPKEVYAFFGLAFYLAQVLEQAVINLAVALNAKGIAPLTVGNIRDLYDRFDSKTFGMILSSARKIIEFDDNLANDLQTALKKRNYLAHHFFKENDANHMTDQGRQSMIDELYKLIGFFKDVDTRFNSVWMAAWEALGISQKWWNEQFNKRKAELLRT